MEPSGIAVLCDSEGRVIEVVRDQLGVSADLEVGVAMWTICDDMSRQKFERFLDAVRTDKAAFMWEMNIALGDELEPLHFTGSLADNGIYVVGARSADDSGKLYEQLLAINNEQVNALRRSIRELRSVKRASETQGMELMEEMTELNNELVNVRRELTKRNRDLKRLNDQKNELLGMAAHDLRNPLGVVSGMAEMLPEFGPLNDDQKDIAKRIIRSAKFMLHLVEDLLDVSAIESGKLDLKIAPVPLSDFIEDRVTANRLPAQAKNIRIEFEVADTAPDTLPMDEHRMVQVINNLLSNAIKYSHEETTIKVSVSRDGGMARIAVKDQGQGIPENELDRLFQPFKTTSVRGTAGEKSTGLGLAITNKVVRTHGGYIDVQSTVGRGSIFSVFLPIEAPPDQA